MLKAIIGFVVAGILIVGGVTIFITLQKDNSKVAEVIQAKSIPEEKAMGKKEMAPAPSTTVPVVGDDQMIKDTPASTKEITEKTVKTGTFNYLDPLHNGQGNVSIIDAGEFYKIKMSSNFKSADAPDAHVYLSSAQAFKDRAVSGVDTSKTINLGLLKNFSGEQEYLVSKKDFEAHDAAVIIWCKRFGIQISRADLK